MQKIASPDIFRGEALHSTDLGRSPGAEVSVAEKGERRWMPPVEQMPPIVQFAIRTAHWCRAKCMAGRKEAAPLLLVGQLALGAKRHLALVEVNGMQFLVGGGSEHVTVIVPVPAKVDAKAMHVGNGLQTNGPENATDKERWQ